MSRRFIDLLFFSVEFLILFLRERECGAKEGVCIYIYLFISVRVCVVFLMYLYVCGYLMSVECVV